MNKGTKQIHRPTVYWVSYKLNGKLIKTCHEDLISAQREVSGAMMGTSIKPTLKKVTLRSDGTWR
jgi:hypothetical protein